MKEPETYGELVARLGLSTGGEEVLCRVYGLVPLDGTKTTQGRIEGEIEKPHRGRVGHYVDLLRDNGLVSTGRGRSRSVSRVLPEYPTEHSLYPHMREEIRSRWADERPHDYIEADRFCEVLSSHGAKRGRWGAPDITLVGGKTLPFLPGKFLDVVTFEVKPTLDVTGLYEALSHRTHATHAYLLCHHPASEGEPDPVIVGRISAEAQRTGVGFILARQPNDYATWEEIAPASRWHPEPEMLHEFVVSLGRLDRNMLRRLRGWLRSDPFLGVRPVVDFSSLDLDEKDQRVAEDIYLEIPTDGSVGWKYFDGWIERADVERIRQRLKERGVIRVVQKGGMKLPDP
ncbi:MAG: hypothetical protein OXU63_01320 [Acidobacteriota bacterium]|nr:hypothetical protein [Acidobacteriota bacterium]